MAKPQEARRYSPREIATGVNNAVLAASRPESAVISETRLGRLREYTQALTEPCAEHIEEGLLSSEELVLVFLSAALLIQAAAYTGGDKMPMVSLASQTKKK